MIIAHLSDLHIDSSNEVIYGINPLQNLQRAVSALKEIKDISIGIITGDISNDGMVDSYIKADEVLSQLPFPVIIINGNHDETGALFSTNYKKMRYAGFVTIDDIDFISVNTVLKAEDGTNRSTGGITQSELSRLKKLVNTGDNKKILFMHHPVILTDSWLDRRILSNRVDFINFVSTSDQIIAVLSGHNHFATNMRIRNTLYSTAPSVSTSYDKNLKPFEEAFQPGFNLISIDKGVCSVETIYL